MSYLALTLIGVVAIFLAGFVGFIIGRYMPTDEQDDGAELRDALGLANLRAERMAIARNDALSKGAAVCEENLKLIKRLKKYENAI